MIQVNRIYLIFNRLVTKKFLVDTSEILFISVGKIGIAYGELIGNWRAFFVVRG